MFFQVLLLFLGEIGPPAVCDPNEHILCLLVTDWFFWVLFSLEVATIVSVIFLLLLHIICLLLDMCNGLNALIHQPFQPHGWAGPPNPDLTWSACWHSHIVNSAHSIRFNLSLPNTACYIPNMTHIRQPMSGCRLDWSEGKVGCRKWWELWNSGKVDYVHLPLALTYRFWPDCVAATSSSTFKMDRSNYMRFKQSSSTLWP